MLSAVLFDLDDTLIDDETASRSSLVAWAEELGLTDPDAHHRWARVSGRHYSRYQQRKLTFLEQRRERVREFLHPLVTDAEADRLFAGYLDHYEACWTVFDDAVPTLRRAREIGLAVAVLTNGEESQQRRKLERLRLLQEIDLFVATSTLSAGKPDPYAFQHVIQLLGIDPSDALMVGDSLENDIRGAQTAGLSAILLDRKDTYVDLDVPRVNSLSDLVFAA